MKKNQEKIAIAANPPTYSTASPKTSPGRNLRCHAEELLKRPGAESEGPRMELETASLVHELQVHQIELQMQNEELQLSRAKAEELLAQYTDLYDFSPTGYMTLDREGTVRQVNLAGALMFGVERSGLMDRRLGLFVVEGYRRVFSGFLEKVFSGQEKEHCEVPLMREGLKHLVVQIEGMRSEDEKECRAVIIDVTDRKLTEESLRRSETKYRELYESMMDAFVKVDMAGRILEFNQTFCAMLGYSPEEIQRLTYVEITPEKWHDMEREIVESQVLLRGYSDIYEKEYRRKDGSVFPIELRTILHRDNEGKPSGMWAIIHDITERKRAEDALRCSEDKYRTVVENILEGVAIFQDGQRKFSNRRYSEILGYSTEEFAPVDFMAAVHPENRELVLRKFALVMQKGLAQPYFECRVITKAGDTRWIGARGTRIAWEEKPSVIVFAEDISERKRAAEKQKKLEEQLQQSQKLEAIGQLSSGVAHDFNNLLGGIMGNAELVRDDLAPGSGLLRYCASIITLCEKAADLTRQLLSFARKAPVEFHTIDLSSFIEQVAKLMDRTIDHSIEIKVDINTQLAFISGDRNQLENALLNIAINARDAMPGGGRLSIILETVEVDKAMFPDELFKALEGPYARISIADTGTGMSKEIKDRIFEPFFTTKEIGKGTGLGLASVYGCVKQHNGYITVKSQMGGGTQFDLYFPIAVSKPPTSPKEENRLLPGKGSLLIVDDEAEFRSILTDMFESLGYTVHTCSDGVEAVEYFRVNNSAIDIVILDLNMPKISGLQCFRVLKGINPNVKVIVSSGYGENEDRVVMRAEGVAAFMQKPYNIAALAQKIADLISTPLAQKG